MTKAQDIKAGMKFDNYGEVIEVAAVKKAHGGVIVMWSGFFGNEFVANGDAINLKRV